MNRRKLRLAAAVALGLALALSPAGAAHHTDSHTYSGTISGGCTYSIAIDTDAQSVDAKVKGCAGIDLAAELTGSYGTGANGDSAVTLNDLKDLSAELAGQSIDLPDTDINLVLDTGVDLSAVANGVNAAKSVASNAASQLAEMALSDLTDVGRDLGIDFTAATDDLLSAENSYCAAFGNEKGMPEPGRHLNSNCDPSDCVGSDTLCNSLNRVDDTNGDDADSDEGQSELCPILNDLQDDFVFVCVPTFLTGNIDAGDKSLVLLPGGALIVLPSISGDAAASLPVISSNKAIVSLGGIVAGYNVELKAPKIGFAAGVVAMLNNLVLLGSDQVSIGSFDIDSFTGSLPDFVDGDDEDSWGATIKNAAADNPLGEKVPTSGTVSIGALISGAKVTIRSADFTLTSSSKISTAGLGPLGQLGGQKTAPGGESDDQGGSHGGYGGLHWDSFTTDNYDEWNTVFGRAPAFDGLADPTRGGDGGGGDGNGDDTGQPGGGVVIVDTHAGNSEIDGTIDVSGTDISTCGGCGDHGGGGAGGSVFLTSKTLAGDGDIDADGGGLCPSCKEDDEGGSGSGGRILLLTTSSGDWKGSAHAYGGYDQQVKGKLVAHYSAVGTGAAGTVFTRSMTFAENGAVTGGTGDWPAGTITVDAGRPAGWYPSPDGTPIPDSWGSSKRKLVISGEARVYASAPDFGEIDIEHGSTLTTSPFAKGHSVLKVKAGTLEVDATSQITVEGRGYAGGRLHDGKGAAPAGTRGASAGYGGSHAGVGGTIDTNGGAVPPGSKGGATYGSATNPKESGGGGGGGDDYPGNPGGGVLEITAGTLDLDGKLAADGQETAGPMPFDPTVFDHQDAGAGGGGSIDVTVTAALSGSGLISADGGFSCLTDSGILIDIGDYGCAHGDSSGGGGGGGGRVRIDAEKACTWKGTTIVAGGWNESADKGSADRSQTTGKSGTVDFTCTKS